MTFVMTFAMTDGAPKQTGGLGPPAQLDHNARMSCLPTTTHAAARQCHTCACARSPVPQRQSGFTLVELMIAVVVMGVLVALAFPSYKDSIRKSRRSDAVAGIATVQQAQERHRANRATYGDFAAALPEDTLTGVSATTSGKHYLMTIANITPSTYDVLATAQGDQADDTKCKVMGARLQGGALRYGSGLASVDWTQTDPDSGKCWAK
jgi:type IV pilus assembly protein PilE